MVFQARPLEPLREYTIARRVGLDGCLGQRQAEERERLGRRKPGSSVELEAVRMVVRAKRLADGEREIARTDRLAVRAGGRRLPLGAPLTAELPQALVAEPAEEHVVGGRLVGMVFEPV